MIELDDQMPGEVAAPLYWGRATQVGIAATDAEVRTRGGRALATPEAIMALQTIRGLTYLPELTPGQVETLCHATANQIERAVSTEEQLTGMLLPGHVRYGRSDSAAEIDTSVVRPVPKVSVEGEIPTLGRLSIRYPLPGVVFSDVDNPSPIIRVADTVLALGFDYPLFLAVHRRLRLTKDLVCYTGIFQVPVASQAADDAWDKIMPNSTRFTGGLNGGWCKISVSK